MKCIKNMVLFLASFIFTIYIHFPVLWNIIFILFFKKTKYYNAVLVIEFVPGFSWYTYIVHIAYHRANAQLSPKININTIHSISQLYNFNHKSSALLLFNGYLLSRCSLTFSEIFQETILKSFFLVFLFTAFLSPINMHLYTVAYVLAAL